MTRHVINVLLYESDFDPEVLFAATKVPEGPTTGIVRVNPGFLQEPPTGPLRRRDKARILAGILARLAIPGAEELQATLARGQAPAIEDP